MSIEWTHGSPDDYGRRITNPELFAKQARSFLTRVVILIQGFAREGAPVDRGPLSQSLTFEVDSSPMPLWGKVGSVKSYAPDMEYGTNALSEKPSVTGSRPFPTGPQLETWARRHGFPNGYIVAGAIKKRGGVKPRRFLRNAFTKAKPQVLRFLRTFAAEIEKAWGK